MLTNDLLLLARKYRIPLSSLNKEVLVDEELLEEAVEYLPDEITAPFAFPGFIFREKGGVALETEEPRVRAVREEYGVDARLWTPPDFHSNTPGIFLEPDYRYSRDTLLTSLINQPTRMVIAARESVLLSLVAEPGWREYSPITVVVGCFYEVEDIFRVENQAFYPPGRSSMGMAFIRLRRPYHMMSSFVSFLKGLFTQRKKKVRVRGEVREERVDRLAPEDLLELFETTREG